MTNAEKYLKKGASVGEFIQQYKKWVNGRSFSVISSLYLQEFMVEQQVIPTLTEDERVILRNIDKNFKYIARVNKQIQVCTVKTSNRGLPCDSGYLFTFNHLFQFIKEGEEYSIEELLK